MEKIANRDADLSISYATHFTVDESFRGAVAPGGETVVYTGKGGGDCGYPFVPGTRYLVYASTTAGRFYAGICSETKPAGMAEAVLRELRALRDRKPVDAVFGAVFLAGGAGASIGASTAQVHATAANGASFSTQTDYGGVYAFPSLPAGTYKIEPDLPAGYGHRPTPTSVQVRSGEACRADTFGRPDGRITGTVIDAAGKPLAGFVMVQPADPVEAEAARIRGGLPGYEVGPDGRFSLPEIPPGRYRLVFHPGTGRALNFRITFYWPSSPGEVIDLALGQHVDGVQFKAVP